MSDKGLFNQVWGCLALVGFIVVLGLNLLSYFESNSFFGLNDSLWFFAPLVFLIVAPMLIQQQQKKKPTSIFDEKSTSFEDVLNKLPMWVGLLTLAVIIYMGYSFIQSMSVLKGQAAITDGSFSIVNHGHVTFVSKAEYIQHKIYELRFWSAHLLIFYLIPAIYYLIYANQLSTDEDLD